MNRHMRRAASKAQVAPISRAGDGIREFTDIIEKLSPYLAQIEGLQSQLESTTELLRTAQDENRTLQAALIRQREVYLHMFARGMGVSLDTVLSMEMEIQNALKTSRTNTEAPAEDSGA